MFSEAKRNFLETWNKEGGLIPQAVAAAINEISTSEVSRKVKAGELESVKVPGLSKGMIPLPVALDMKRQRKKAESKKQKNSKNGND